MRLITKIIKLMILLLVFTGCGKIENNQNKNEVYGFLYQTKLIEVGKVYDENVLGKSNSFFDNENCAFSEKDTTYVYDNFQLQTYENKNHEMIIYSIYLFNNEVSTKEGLKIYDTYNDMINLYGINYVKEGNLYIYKKGQSDLNIIIQDNIIESIEYYLNTL